MGRIFLGKWWHWLALIVFTVALRLAGKERMHVIEFNTFVIALLVGIGAVVILLLATTRPGEQVTREVIELEQDD